MIKEQGLDPFDALEAVRQATADAKPDEAFLGGGDVRVGDFILLVDSDTRIPQDCILPTVSELLESPEVAFTQHLITPMQVRIRIQTWYLLLPAASIMCRPIMLGACSCCVHEEIFFMHTILQERGMFHTLHSALQEWLYIEFAQMLGTLRVQVSHDYFENAMAFFTAAIYIAIKVPASTQQTVCICLIMS